MASKRDFLTLRDLSATEARGIFAKALGDEGGASQKPSRRRRPLSRKERGHRPRKGEHAHASLLRGRVCGARDAPGRGHTAGQPARAGRARPGHRARPLALRRPDCVSHEHPGAPRADGGARRGTRHQRPLGRRPPGPSALRRLHDRGGARVADRGQARRVDRRWGKQHGKVVRRGRRALRVRAPRRQPQRLLDRGPRDRALHDRPGGGRGRRGNCLYGRLDEHGPRGGQREAPRRFCRIHGDGSDALPRQARGHRAPLSTRPPGRGDSRTP